MQLVDRKTFLSLPSGTVYAKYEPCICQEICIKHDTISDNDWRYAALDTISFIDAESSTESVDKILAMKNGDSIKTNIDVNATFRDGLFDKDQQFMVYSQDEIKDLIALLTKTLDMNGPK